MSLLKTKTAKNNQPRIQGRYVAVCDLYLGGGFKYVLFSTLVGEDFQFD